MTSPWIAYYANRLWFRQLGERLGLAAKSDEGYFSNFGFVPTSDEDRKHKWSDWNTGLNMYLKAFRSTNLEGKQVVEVSCGGGGGAAHCLRDFNAAGYVGFDITPQHVEYANSLNQHKNAKFACGSAEELDLKTNSSDIVFSIEASHIYPDFDAFVKEASRVLRPGGKLVLIDFRSYQDKANVIETLEQFFTVQKNDDISLNVAAAALSYKPHFLKWILLSVALPLIKLVHPAYFLQILFQKGSLWRHFMLQEPLSYEMYKTLLTRKLTYFCIVVTKK